MKASKNKPALKRNCLARIVRWAFPAACINTEESGKALRAMSEKLKAAEKNARNQFKAKEAALTLYRQQKRNMEEGLRKYYGGY